MGELKTQLNLFSNMQTLYNHVLFYRGIFVLIFIFFQDLFVLLDLLGTSDVQFYNYFKNTERWYARLVSYEQRLNDLQLLHQRPFMFKKRSAYNSRIEDDHIPFLERGKQEVFHVDQAS